MSPLDIGPWTTLPTMGLLIGALGGTIAAGIVAALVAGMFKQNGLAAVGMATGCAVVAHAGGILGMIRPWKGRFLGQWPFAVLHASVVSGMLVVALMSLVYFAADPDRTVLALATVATWFAGLLAEIAAYARVVKRIDPAQHG